MSARLISYLVIAIASLLLLLAGSGVLLFHYYPYDDFVQIITAEMGRTDLATLLKTKYFTAEKYHTLKQISLLISPLSFALLIMLLRYRKKAMNFVSKCTDSLWINIRYETQALLSGSRTINLWLLVCLILIVLRSVYYAGSFYIQHDEAWNYTFFLQHNFLYSLFAYNNYPLHNVLSKLILMLLPDNTFTLRLPSIVGGVFSCILVFGVIKKICQNEVIALCCMMLFASLPITVFYMLYARGVIFELLLAWLTTGLLVHDHRQGFSDKRVLLLIILNAFGVWCMLTHLYFIVMSAVALIVVQGIDHRGGLRHSIFYFFGSLLLSALFLSPMMAGSGLAPGISAGKAQANYLVLHLLPYHCYADFSTGIWFGFYLLIAVNLFLIIDRRKTDDRLLPIFNLTLLATPLLIGLLSMAWLPERALAFLCIPTIITFALVTARFKLKAIVLSLFTLMICGALNYSIFTHPKLNWSKEKDRQVCLLAEAMQKKAVTHIYDESGGFAYYIAGLQYYYTLANKELVYNTRNPESNRYLRQRPAAADCVVSDHPIAEGHLIFRYEDILVYALH